MNKAAINRLLNGAAYIIPELPQKGGWESSSPWGGNYKEMSGIGHLRLKSKTIEMISLPYRNLHFTFLFVL